ncbi:hypothetical protein PC117_g8132, partial [Phytophthora cactorum]
GHRVGPLQSRTAS